jgi:hypothetical protein
MYAIATMLTSEGKKTGVNNFNTIEMRTGN